MFLAEYIYQYSVKYAARGGDPRYLALYAQALREHVRRVRAYGGLCLIADSSPVPLPARVLARFAALNRLVARELGCAYTGALSHLWNPVTAVRDGLTLVDGSHPTRAGYQRMVKALAPVLLPLIRARVRGRGSRAGPP